MTTRTPLATGDISKRTLTVFAVGGSGIRSIEPLLHLCALGLGPRQLKILLVDPDQSNDAVQRIRGLIDLYLEARTGLTDNGPADGGYFRTEVVDVLDKGILWSPIADDASFGSSKFKARVARPLMSEQAEDLAVLHDLLFSKETQEMDMTLGFRGVPAIGTVFMHRLRRAPFIRQLLSDAQTEPDSVFFAIGSIFGGTGAAGLPVIGRTLVAGLPAGEGGRGAVRGISPERVGAALLLPYFTLPAPATQTAADGGIRPDSALFAQNAAAALPTYAQGDAQYGGLYAIGDSEPREQLVNEVGGQAQANRSHYVELYAALAALDFAARGGERSNDAKPVFHYTAVGGDAVRWSDLPIDIASEKRLMGGLVSIQSFLTYFRPNGNSHPHFERDFRGATWRSQLGLDGKAFEQRSKGLDALGKFFRASWAWLAELRGSTPPLVLLNTQAPQPADAALCDALEGRHSTVKTTRTTREDFALFRFWNVAAAKRSGTGFGEFLAMMREGNEAYAQHHFPQVSHE
ncbi:MAG: hypothetical protein ABJE47_11830 [bacterium]